MSKSKGKKHRERLKREGKPDVTAKRGSWGEVNPYVRQTKTKQETLSKALNKHRKNHSQSMYDEGGSFHLALFVSFADCSIGFSSLMSILAKINKNEKSLFLYRERLDADSVC